MALDFEWDQPKSRQNRKKHGVSFHEGATAFADEFSFTIPDPEHSIGEHRFLLLGRGSSGNLLVISHTERGDRIRIINVRRATKRERKLYENSKP
jgi:uncharacterized DUF497 family protein